MTRRAVILFARTPEAEAEAKGLTRKAVAIFSSLTEAWLRAAVATGSTPVIACDADARRRFAAIAPDVDREYIDQPDGGFAQRLVASASRAAERRLGPIIIAGIDAPPPPDLASAFELLERGAVDAAIAPARDGGVNIIGFRTPPLDLLLTFVPRDPTIAARCNAYFSRVYCFRTSSDIDSAGDVAFAKRESVWREFESLLGACVSLAFPRERPRFFASYASPSLSARAPPAA